MKKGMAHKGLRSGFTLIEILVVLVIMGFLVAMVAPKLSGVVESAVGTTDDTNQQRLREVLNVFVNQSKGMPSGMVNMITFTTDYTPANVTIAQADDGDKQNGKEFLSAELVERMKPMVHYINQAEAEELIGMGIKGTFTLANVTANTGAGVAEDANILENMVRKQVAADLPVFMIGVGDSDDDGALTAAEFATGTEVTVAGTTVTESTTNLTTSVYDDTGTTLTANAMSGGTFVRFDQGRELGRIVMGMTNRGDLVQGGMLEESGVSPRSTQKGDFYSWGNYLIVLPRLKATMERLDIDADGTVQMNAIGIDGETGESVSNKKIVLRTPGTGYPYFIGQEAENFLTADPQGHVWGSVAETWAIAFQD